MGVLLALQAMDRTRLELLGDTYQDDSLEMGMSFLRAASSKSNLAARYVDLLQRIRKRPNDQYSIHTAPRDNLITIQDGIGTDPSLPALPEGDPWLDRGQNELGSSLNLDFLDFDDLLYGTGLPRDLLGQDCREIESATLKSTAESSGLKDENSSHIARLHDAFRLGRRIVTNKARDIPGLQCVPPELIGYRVNMMFREVVNTGHLKTVGAAVPPALAFCLTGIVTFGLIYVVYQRFFSPLATVPGPFWASLTPFWKLTSFKRGDFHETILTLHRRYGPIVRIAPTEVIISDRSAIREIYSTVQARDYLKTDYYDAFTAFRPTIFGQRDPHLHAQRKRIVSHGYSMNALQAMESFVQERLQIFMHKFSEFAKTSSEVNLGKWCHFFAFDVIGELAFSEGFGMLESGVEDEHIALINKQMEFGSTIGMVPSLIPYTKWTSLPIPWLRNLQAGRDRLKELTRSRVERRQEKISDRKDLLGRLIEAKDPVTGQMLDAIDLRTEAFSSIVAGSDSTSSALGYTFYHILGHPKAYDLLTTEIREAFPQRRYGTDELPPTYAELGRLPYLQAVIKESLRLTPPATINLPRYVPEGGRVVAGTFFPAKTIVGISAVPVHLDPQSFGPDAAMFNPGRWIEGSGGITPEEMQRYWIPFGHGSRQCIGKNVAMMELIKLVGTLLLYFDLELVDDGDEKRSEIPRSKSFFFARMETPLLVRVKERS
ncbi:hypothetical protein H2202_005369 [Exophiala xenobiotica]|nr:hypothetical protein H2202_005369 [Exophiala xenobiotica]